MNQMPLTMLNIGTPEPKAGEVRINILVTGLNHLDPYLRLDGVNWLMSDVPSYLIAVLLSRELMPNTWWCLRNKLVKDEAGLADELVTMRPMPLVTYVRAVKVVVLLNE
ncbi:hypothetical protein H6F90_11335 [Trichocoleus sp. FACHB-591]|uniref:hypothetical protein n=1 Tax=Trichocoleus sp. FACHB-591 TaxID=2692872 RepID=UPI001686ECB0|nr:hypothetical protein [Trichocoleus sp. FACHB-591]MBD2095745.1 hypothetical protein [Trichocoleus sp. FACHB-591]